MGIAATAWAKYGGYGKGQPEIVVTFSNGDTKKGRMQREPDASGTFEIKTESYDEFLINEAHVRSINSASR